MSGLTQSMRRYVNDLRTCGRSEATLNRKTRNLAAIVRDADELGIALNPQLLGEPDIRRLLLHWQSAKRGISCAYQRKLVTELGRWLAYHGNPTLGKMKAVGLVKFPPKDDGIVQVLGDEELARLRAAAAEMRYWTGSVARFLVGVLPFCGLRPKEVRLAKLTDLDLDRMRIYVSHPKGEGSWATRDFAPIVEEALPAIRDYIVERAEYLGTDESDVLIPLRWANAEQDITPPSDAWLRKVKAELVERSGVKFRGLKTFRASFAQEAKDRGAPIEAVSCALRHKTTATTEKWYARIRADNAFAEIQAAFRRPVLKAKDRAP